MSVNYYYVLKYLAFTFSIFSTHGLIGPECSKSVESIALLARGWNTAVVSVDEQNEHQYQLKNRIHPW